MQKMEPILNKSNFALSLAQLCPSLFAVILTAPPYILKMFSDEKNARLTNCGKMKSAFLSKILNF